ncbi:MAG TPA: hypothetical protein VNU45_01530 [Rummeliibacillus sp.]|nr:hypothetical protein [Rummeliibacillus sp.]
MQKMRLEIITTLFVLNVFDYVTGMAVMAVNWGIFHQENKIIALILKFLNIFCNAIKF